MGREALFFSFAGLLGFYSAKALRYAALGRGTLGPKCPKPRGFDSPDPKTTRGSPRDPSRYVTLRFCCFFATLDKGKHSSIRNKTPATMPSPLRRSLFRGGTLEGKCCFFRLPVCLPFTWRRLSAMPPWDAALWGQSAQSPGVSIPRTPKRLGARPETPPVMLRYVSVAFLLPLIKENIVLSETKHLLQCLLL